MPEIDANRPLSRWRRTGQLAAGRDFVVPLADDRRMGFREYGLPDGFPVLALHGTPGSRLKFTVTEPIACELGLRVIAPDRWGYGLTSDHPAPTLAHFGDDIVRLADQLRLERFAVMGVSGGGPYAVAVAARSRDRVCALALVAPVGPIAGEAADEISAFHQWCFGPFARRPKLVGGVFRAFRAVLGVAPRVGMRLAMSRVSPADQVVLAQGDVAPRLAQTFAEGLRPGSQGPVIDLTVFSQTWGVDLAAADMPACLWLGTADLNVPPAAARLLADRLANCQLVLLPDAGHLWIAHNYAQVLGWIGHTQTGAALATPGNKLA